MKVDKNLAEKIKEFLKGLVEKLEKAIKGLHGQSAEAELLRDFDIDELEELKSLWTSALVDTDIIRIYAEPFAFNIGSCRVLEKNDFQCEGILRSNAVKNGKVLDMKMYSKLKTKM